MPKQSVLSSCSIFDIYKALVNNKSGIAAAKALGVSRLAVLQNHVKKFTFNGDSLDCNSLKNLPESLVKEITLVEKTTLTNISIESVDMSTVWYSSSMIEELIKPLRDGLHDRANIKIADNFPVQYLNAWCRFIHDNHACSDYLLLPLNINNSHWVLVYINTVTSFLAYIDPFGAPPPEDLHNGLNELKNKERIEFNECYISTVILQKDNYQCGPWLVLIMQTLLAGNMDHDGETLASLLLSLQASDMAQIRLEQQQCFASEVNIGSSLGKRAHPESRLTATNKEPKAKKTYSKLSSRLIKKPSQDDINESALYDDMQSLLAGTASREVTELLLAKFADLGFTPEHTDIMLKKHKVFSLNALLEYGHLLRENGLSAEHLMAILPPTGAESLFVFISDIKNWVLLTTPDGINLSHSELVKIGRCGGGYLALTVLIAHWQRLTQEFCLTKSQIVSMAAHNGARPLFELLLGYTEGQANWSILTGVLGFDIKQIVSIASNGGATQLFKLLLGKTGHDTNWHLLKDSLGFSNEQIVSMASHIGARKLFELLLGSRGGQTNWNLLRMVLGLSKEQIVSMASHDGATPLFELLLGSTENETNWLLLTETLGFSKEAIVSMASHNGSKKLFELLLGKTENHTNWHQLTEIFGFSKEQIVSMASNGGASHLFELLLGNTEGQTNWSLLTDIFRFDAKQVVSMASNGGASQLFELLLGKTGGKANWLVLKDTLGFSKEQIVKMASNNGARQLFELLLGNTGKKTNWFLLTKTLDLSREQIVSMASNVGARQLFELLLGSTGSEANWFLLTETLGLSREQIVSMASHDAARLLFELLLGNTDDEANWIILTNTFGFVRKQIVSMASHDAARQLFELLLEKTGNKANWFLLTDTMGFSNDQIVKMASNHGATSLFQLLLGSTENETNWFLLTDTLGFSKEQIVMMASNHGATSVFQLLLGKTDNETNWFLLTDILGFSKEQIVNIASNHRGATQRLQLLLKHGGKLTAADGLNCSQEFLAGILTRREGYAELSLLLNESVSQPTLSKDDLLRHMRYRVARSIGRNAALEGYHGCRHYADGPDYLVRYYQGYFEGLVAINIISAADAKHMIQDLTKKAVQLQHKKDDLSVYSQAHNYLDIPQIKTWRMLCRSIWCDEVDFPFAYYKVPQATTGMSDWDYASYLSGAIIINFDEYSLEGLESIALSLNAKQQLSRLFMHKYYNVLHAKNTEEGEHFDDFEASFYQGYLFIRHYGYLFDLMGEGVRNFRRDMADIPLVDFNRIPVKEYLNHLATQACPVVAKTLSVAIEEIAGNQVVFNPDYKVQEQDLVDLLEASYQASKNASIQITQPELPYEKYDDIAEYLRVDDSPRMLSFARSPNGFFTQVNSPPPFGFTSMGLEYDSSTKLFNEDDDGLFSSFG